MQEEQDGSATFRELADYVVNQPASEKELRPAETASGQEGYIRDKGVAGWTLRNFAEHRKAKEAKLRYAKKSPVSP